MKGLHINKKRFPLEKVFQESGTLALLARQENLEIMLQEVDIGMGFFLYPAEDDTTLEFFYIIDGEVESDVDGEKQVLGRNDYITVKGLEESLIFKVKQPLTLLWITNEPLFHQISREIQQLIEIVSHLEPRGSYYWNHSRRVQKLCMKIGKELRLNKNRLHDLFIGAALHDIGKVNIPEEIMNKSSRLTKSELEIVKKHPVEGAGMVNVTYYDEISAIIEQHHERIDGSGYPFGLIGKQIKIEAKIIAVADSFDTMTHASPRRAAFTKEAAFKKIKEMAGKLYEQEVVDAFEKIILVENILKEEVND
ncbi:HD-GYP domain-containing protein [Bacillus sp. 2205SS5-2]|uniref:HD-GYP domain-containing protein n=1 Tax=Bacillus sp. 2205SS5-2 TaxID=3109031 RepID=UPI003005EA4E